MLAYEANSTIEKMNCIISKVSINSDSVAFEAARLLDLADKMTAEAVGIATQFDSLATTSEEMSTTSGDISRNCQTAAFEALQASQTAENGVNVVENTVRVMNRIANRVKKTAKTVQSLGSCGDQIGEIIGTIEDIADQTNLLALNAAIEAARAGEQGRGFAVVADEVRALAERTTTATHEISDMIKAIQGETAEVVFAMNEGISEVERGMDEAAKSGVALRVIQEQVNSVNTHISQIATAAEEQSATTAEISRNIQHICEAMQHSAQSGNESVVATNQLSNLAEDLKMYMGQFKV
ncbi:hypothetical protein AOG2_02170 [Geobacter sp. AOG2]|nr:hypothetical protein AOG2_02170 [Geobacter sp. AOG2]